MGPKLGLCLYMWEYSTACTLDCTRQYLISLRRASQKNFLGGASELSPILMHALREVRELYSFARKETIASTRPSRRASAIGKKFVERSHRHTSIWRELAGIFAVLREALQSRRRGGICVEWHHQMGLQPHEAARRALLQCGPRGGEGDELCGSGGASLAARSSRPSWRRWMRSGWFCPPAVDDAARAP